MSCEGVLFYAQTIVTQPGSCPINREALVSHCAAADVSELISGQLPCGMTDLYVFRNDLRLTDNPALAEHASASRILCVYVDEPAAPWFQASGVGAQRYRFQRESLRSLQDALRSNGQELLHMRGHLHEVLPPLVSRFRVARVALANAPGTREQKSLERLRAQLSIPVQVHSGNQLYHPSRMADWLPTLPQHFTPFREHVESRKPESPGPELQLPPPPEGLVAETIRPPETRPHPACAVHGGEKAAWQRLQAWMFRERAIDTYRETRNDLEGLFSSSGLSPWLANGCLSVRTVAAALDSYEQQYGATPSSQHVWHELLWREFFHWRALRDPASLFRRGGERRRLTHCTFEPRSYARWCAGATDYPLVNALMHQLVETGWMSNRGRQIAASCLVNELGIDWRYGAAFFEKHLVDYDVASNYGNWQYIAGVGADPRGGRHFNLDKQAALYDPEGEFTARWKGYCAPQPLFVTDAADWPLSPVDS